MAWGNRFALAAAGAAAVLLLSSCADNGSAEHNGHNGHGEPTSGHGDMPMGEVSEISGDGLADSVDGYTLVTDELPDKAGDDAPISFQIKGADGEPLTDYRVNAAKKLHLLVVRDDMQGFQHLHPELDGATWSVTADLAEGGEYRLYTEFVPADADEAILLGTPFAVRGADEPVAVPPPATEVEVDGFTVSRPDGAAELTAGEESELKFAFADAQGEPAELETYLDSYAHVSAFNTETRAATHLHPLEKPGEHLEDATVTIHAEFPNAGDYRVFIEFQVGGKVRVAAFTVAVK